MNNGELFFLLVRWDSRVLLRSLESGFIVGMIKALRPSEEFALEKILRM